MKTLALAGVGDGDATLLRKHLTAAGRALDEAWSFVDAESPANLLIVDLDGFAGRVARVRALDEGRHYAVLADANADVLDANLVLRRPLRLAALAEALNTAARMPPPPRRNHADFASPARAPVEFCRADDVSEAAKAGDDPSPRASFATPRRPRECTDFSMLMQRGAVRIERDGLPALVLDPANGVFHAEGKLAALEPYFLDRVNGRECHAIGPLRLAQVRARIAAQPVLRLQWLGGLLRSNGCLPATFDPGGSYRLQRWLPLDGEYRKAFRIGTVMLRSMPLHEAARKSDATLDEVIDVVNAYEALGWVEWQPRKSRYAESGRDGRKRAEGSDASSSADTRKLLAAALLLR